MPPSRLTAGGWPDASWRHSGDRFQTSQWVNAPWAASGSSQTRANERVPAGGSPHSKGGESFRPSAVYWTGIPPPSPNAGLLIGIGFLWLLMHRPLTRVCRRRRPAALPPGAFYARGGWFGTGFAARSTRGCDMAEFIVYRHEGSDKR